MEGHNMKPYNTMAAVTSLALTGCVSFAAQQAPMADKEELVAAEKEWGAAFASGDSSVSERLLAEDFVGTDTKGRRYDKAQIVAEVREGPPLVSDVTEVDDIRFEGHVAILRGHDDIVGPAPGAARRTNVWTDVWANRAGKWVLIAAQDTSAMPPKP
jgi:hypothetical protein